MTQNNLPSCKFRFARNTVIYYGYSLETSQGGFNNVAVSDDELGRIVANAEDQGMIDALLDLEPTENGLYSLAWNFKTIIVK